MVFWKCESCEKWNVNFGKNEILMIWILGKLRFWKCEFLDKIWMFATVWCSVWKIAPRVILYSEALSKRALGAC